MEEVDFTIPHPCNIIIAGATGSGKTFLTLELINRRWEAFSEPLQKVVYVYREFQDAFIDLQTKDSNVRFTNDLLEIENLTGPLLLIIDDFQDM